MNDNLKKYVSALVLDFCFIQESIWTFKSTKKTTKKKPKKKN
jgi:hypothetical protein